MDSGLAAALRPGMTEEEFADAKKKKGQLALALFCCARPGPDDPGGLGAEESETERTGPTQCILVAIQRGRRLAEKGPYYDSANDPVTGPIGRFAASDAR